MATATAGEIWELVKELDDSIKHEDPTDWELDFIADMMKLRHQAADVFAEAARARTAPP